MRPAFLRGDTYPSQKEETIEEDTESTITPVPFLTATSGRSE